MGLVKIFSGSEILALALKSEIDAEGVNVVIKNNIQSARLGGFGGSDLAVELFMEESDYGKVSKVIEEFRIKMQ